MNNLAATFDNHFVTASEALCKIDTQAEVWLGFGVLLASKTSNA
ncbi:MAG: hypothetical protein ABSA47_03290 [Verrucomicrobiota bacterium]